MKTALKETKEVIELVFPKLNHFWMDSGTLGLYRLAQEISEKETFNMKTSLNADGIVFEGTEPELERLLDKCYWALLARHYNQSNENQKKRNDGFYYNTKTEKFERFDKVESTPIAKLLRPKYAQPIDQKSSIKYKNKKNYQLPEKHSALQKKLNEFLSEIEKREGKKLPPTGNVLLVNGANAYQPSVWDGKTDRKFKFLKKGKTKGQCFICGMDTGVLVNSSGVFPFLSGPDGSLSCTPYGSGPQKVCAKCAFIGKFVPMNGFYWSNFDGSFMQAFFPYSVDLQKMNIVYSTLHAAEQVDPNLRCNFVGLLGGYFQKPFELTFSFLYTLYQKAVSRKSAGSSGEDVYELDFEKLYEIAYSKAPLEFIVMVTEELGKTHMGKMAWPFQDADYFFRLLDRLEKGGVKIKQVMRNMVDHKQSKTENMTLMRNRICERILKKQSVIDLAEQHAFYVCKSNDIDIGPIFHFVVSYEAILNEGGARMDQAAIDTAVSLGERIGASIANAREIKKGDLYALRKARKLEDFLNGINRVQFKYSVSVPTDLFKYFNTETYAVLKQFCMIAALNKYNGIKYYKEKKEGE